MAEVNCDFPTESLLPKKETGVTSFLNKFPNYDGRGVTIAIFDSGVDPGAAGLQVTTDGKPKVIGRYDCSGAGDVDISTVVEVTDGAIKGLSGRTLKIPESWNNPTGKFHVGLKNGYDLYPKSLKEKVEKERREKFWDPEHKSVSAETIRKQQNFLKTLDENKTQTLSREDKLLKEEYEAQVEVLQAFEKKYFDGGIMYDCVVFHDGEIWRACLDTSLNGDLAACTLLGEYSKTQEYATLSSLDLLNYSINVFDDGNLLEVVGFCSSHGTHVASIAAANFPDEPERNGVAPGAQIVSLTLGDSRLYPSPGMETGAAVVRSMIHVMKSHPHNKMHVINMSYGERANFSSSGRIAELMAEVVDKCGTVWVASAGNNGPALSTISCPPDLNYNGVIGVGAYVSPEMMTSEYSLRRKQPGMPFTWTSRGPTPEGAKGVSVCAPGAAITSVPCSTLRGCQLMNGTSMAAPHCTGVVALLISGMLAQKLPYSPFSVKQALENTAQFISNLDEFAQGHGLLQVEKAFDHLVSYCDRKERDVRFQVSCAGMKGIYIRGKQTNKPRDFGITVEPIFLDSDNMASEKKIDFQMSLALACDASWVSCPSYLEMMNIQRVFSVKVDPSGLPEGVHRTSIRAYDVSCVEKGPVFNVEVTVVRPTAVPDTCRGEIKFQNVEFKPNTIKRHFVVVPDDVSWAVLTLKGLEEDKTERFVIHCVQLKPKTSCSTFEFHKMVTVSSQTACELRFQVQGGVVLEYVIAKYWTCLGDMKLDYSIMFNGVRPSTPSVTMHHAGGIHSLELCSGIHPEEIAPTIQLKNNITALKPAEAKVSPLNERDVIPPSRQIYQLVLSYNFQTPKAAEVTPNCSLFSSYLYESEFESQLWLLFDSNKQFLAAGDFCPSKYSCKLEKGDYVLKLQIRHEKRELLDKLVDLPILLRHKLPSPITVDVYASYSQAVINGKKMASAVLPVAKPHPIYIAPIPNDKLLKSATVGQYLSGSIVYVKDEMGKKVDYYPFNYILVEANKKNNSKPASDKTKWEEYEEALRDLYTSWLSKLENNSESQNLYEELVKKYPDHLSLHTSMMSNLEPDSKRILPGQDLTKALENASKILALTKTVCQEIDETELLAFIGMKSDHRPDAAKIKTKMDRNKSVIIETLGRKGVALSQLHIAAKEGKASTGDHAQVSLADIDAVMQNLLQYADANDVKTTVYFGLWHAAAHEHYGKLIKLALKMYEDKSSKELDECVAWAMGKAGWAHAQRLHQSNIPIRHPPAYRLF
ncbi:tripeptidyl-peptidase 2 isoform X2 [Nilaparvata lugens]|uniref:tripeptidyl-peptidase 2 isoform X2 n=1 Tax=Nilaparvata lugens TaxID=108931 RepID=UPI00193E6524|nr:tripeptidyl-peptidase 2 isoform X2 [Nilaparvata lugens]